MLFPNNAQTIQVADQMIPYLNFVYNTTVHKPTGQTPFSLVFGQECKYPIELLLPEAPGHEIGNYEFTRWLNEQFREAHMNARETLGYRQGRQKDLYQKKIFGEELKPGEKVWLFAPQKAKSRKFFFPGLDHITSSKGSQKSTIKSQKT